MYQKKFMSLINVLKSKVKRHKEKLKDLESFVSDSTASSIQKQEYVELKAKIEAYEDIIDLAESLSFEEK